MSWILDQLERAGDALTDNMAVYVLAAVAFLTVTIGGGIPAGIWSFGIVTGGLALQEVSDNKEQYIQLLWISIAVAAGLTFGQLTAPIVTTVTDLQWSTTVEKEHFVAIDEQQWCGDLDPDHTWIKRERDVFFWEPDESDRTPQPLPADAYNVHRRWEFSHTVAVKTGETCHTSTDGTESCSDDYRYDDVYRWRCHYNVNRWKTRSHHRLTGSSPEAAFNVPAVAQSQGVEGGGPVLGSTRIGDKTANFSFEVAAVGRNGRQLSAECNTDAEAFLALRKGQTMWSDYKVIESVRGSRLECPNLENFYARQF